MERLATKIRRAAAVAARHPRRTIALWLLLVVACLAAGSLTGTRALKPADAGTGESQRADRRVAATGLRERASESILVRSRDAATTRAAVRDLERRLALPQVAALVGARQAPALSRAGGRTQLLQVYLRGDPDTASKRVGPVLAALAAAERAHSRARFDEGGTGSAQKAFEDVLGNDLQRAELSSLPLTLVILVLAFGSLVAASVPLLLAITSVAAALGALGVVSQITPTDQSTATVIVLIGLAVGIDYSLFYIRREREERRAGRGPEAALDIAAGTVGRAVFMSGLTVMVALSGLLISGLPVFESMALATMLVALIAVIASLTVLPAVLSLLGDRVNRGRIPGLARLHARHGRGAWARLAGAVTRRPRAALVIAASLLATLAVPALQLKTAATEITDLPKGTPVVASLAAIERAFPGAPRDAQIVVTGERLGAPQARAALMRAGAEARAITGGRGAIGVRVARGGRTALVSVPMPERDADGAGAIVKRLRAEVAPRVPRMVAAAGGASAAAAARGASVAAAGGASAAEALVTGDAARNADFSGRLDSATPLVIAFVLSLAFLLLLGAFRSAPLAAAVIGLNALSIGAAYGLLVAVFQNTWAEGLIGFTSTGTITDWLPLFAFVILFGLSMDYTILVLERIREERRNGLPARDAAAAGVAGTAGTVTSAAIIMVAVFGVFATLGLLQFKQFGVGLAVAILLDATIVRGVALPAAITLLGDSRWRVPLRRPHAAPAAHEPSRELVAAR